MLATISITTAEQKEYIRQAIQAATTREEIDKIEKQLKVFPIFFSLFLSLVFSHLMMLLLQFCPLLRLALITYIFLKFQFRAEHLCFQRASAAPQLRANRTGQSLQAPARATWRKLEWRSGSPTTCDECNIHYTVLFFPDRTERRF